MGFSMEVWESRDIDIGTTNGETLAPSSHPHASLETHLPNALHCVR
jgi:hypothetical protein